MAYPFSCACRAGPRHARARRRRARARGRLDLDLVLLDRLARGHHDLGFRVRLRAGRFRIVGSHAFHEVGGLASHVEALAIDKHTFQKLDATGLHDADSEAFAASGSVAADSGFRSTRSEGFDDPPFAGIFFWACASMPSRIARPHTFCSSLSGLASLVRAKSSAGSSEASPLNEEQKV